MKFIYSVVTIILVTACNADINQTPLTFDYGKTANGLYTNSYFNMTMPYDTSWFVQEKDAMNKLVLENSEMIFNDDQLTNKQLEASMINTAYLFTIFNYEVGAPVDFNPSLIVMAENLKNYPGIETGKDYLYHSKKLLKNSKINYTFGNDSVDIVKIGNEKFHRLRAYIETPDVTISQHYMCRITKGFSLAFIISYASPEKKLALETMLGKVQF